MNNDRSKLESVWVLREKISECSLYILSKLRTGDKAAYYPGSTVYASTFVGRQSLADGVSALAGFL